MLALLFPELSGTSCTLKALVQCFQAMMQGSPCSLVSQQCNDSKNI